MNNYSKEKKILKFGILAMFFLALLSTVNADLITIWGDRFDGSDQNPISNSNWSYYESAASNNDPEIYNNALLIDASGGGSGETHLKTEGYINGQFANVQEIHFKVYLDQLLTSDGGQIQFRLQNNDSNDFGSYKNIQCKFIAAGNLQCYNGSAYGSIGNALSTNQWYNISFRNISYAGNIDVYIDGVFTNTIPSLSASVGKEFMLYFKEASQQFNVSFDDFSFRNASVLETETPPAPPAGEYPEVDIPTYTFTLSANLTDGNYTDNPVRWAYNGSYNYKYSIPDYFAYWKFNQTGNLTDERLINNATNVGALHTSSGFDGWGYSSDEDGYLNVSPFYNGSHFATTGMTVSAWVKAYTRDGDYQMLVSNSKGNCDESDGGFQFGLYKGIPYMLVCQNGDTDSRSSFGNTALTYGDWTHVAVAYEVGEYPNVYLNGQNISNINATDVITNYMSALDLSIGATGIGGFILNGSIDEVRLYNRSLSTNEIYMLYLNNSPRYDCDFYVNTTVQTSMESNETDLSSTQTMSWTTTAMEAGYVNNITCTDYYLIASGQADDVFVDTITPISENTQYTNNSYYFYNYNTTFKINSTINDTNLFATNFSFIHNNGSAIYNQFNTSLTVQSMNWNYSLNMWNKTVYPPGKYYWRVEAWDSHTKKEINPDEYDIVYGENGELLMNDALLIYGEELKNIVAYFSTDRYKLKITFDDQELSHTFRLFNTDNMYYLPDSGYKGHLVWWGKYKRWIDFEGQNIKDVKVTEINTSIFEITIQHHWLTDEIELDSIGDLNYLHRDYHVNLADPMVIEAHDYEFYIANITSNLTKFTATVYNSTGGVLYTESTTDGRCELPVISGKYNTTVTSTSYLPGYRDLNFTASNSSIYYLNSSLTTYISFFDHLGNPQNTTGVQADVNSSWNFTSQYKIGVSSLDVSEGKVVILFNPVNGTFRQYYEWNNDGSVSDNIDLYHMKVPNLWTYVRVTDASGTGLQDAEVEAYYSYAGADSDNKNDFVMFTQKLTDADGYSAFWLDTESLVRLDVRKTGYVNQSLPVTPQDLDATTKDLAISFMLESVDTLPTYTIELVMPLYYKANTTQIDGFVNYEDGHDMHFNTSYYSTLTEMSTFWMTDKYTFQLDNGTHYLHGQNFTFHLYLNNDYVTSINVTYVDPTTVTDSFIIDGIDSEISFVLLFIGLIIISMLMGTLIQSNTVGATTFRVGAIVIAIFNVAFLNLALINLIYMVFKLIYRNISE